MSLKYIATHQQEIPGQSSGLDWFQYFVPLIDYPLESLMWTRGKGAPELRFGPSHEAGGRALQQHQHVILVTPSCRSDVSAMLVVFDPSR